MKSRKAIAILISTLLVMGFTPAKADQASDRAATVEILKAKYLTVLDAQHAELLALKIKAKADPSILKQANTVLREFDTNYAAIVEGLNNPNQALQPLIDLCEEETEEFANYIYHLKEMINKLRTIQCVKGKVTKTITALTPVCPKGFTKKKK
jgi:hypothetical protein